jgi:arabinofuranan 3-O-arabinosyltransferase
VLVAGTQHLAVEAGIFAVDDLRLQSPAPQPLATTALAGGSVLDSGSTGRGTYDHVRVAVRGPSWLVLGEGYDRGWRAWCDGRALGTPTPVDGYANGWRVGPSCHRVRFAFAPNRLALLGYVVSALAALACLALLLVGVRRRRSRLADLAPPPLASDERVRAWPLPHAVLAAVLGGAAFGFVFGLSAGALAVAAIALVLWRGIGARALTLTAAVLLGVVVPTLYLAAPGSESGGNHFAYASQHLAAHWVGVAALGLLTGALWRTLRSAGAPATAPAVHGVSDPVAEVR